MKSFDRNIIKLNIHQMLHDFGSTQLSNEYEALSSLLPSPAHRRFCWNCRTADEKANDLIQLTSQWREEFQCLCGFHHSPSTLERGCAQTCYILGSSHCLLDSKIILVGGLVKFVPAVAYQSCLNLSETFHIQVLFSGPLLTKFAMLHCSSGS